ncbi:alpha-2Da adrenergic receptor-like isoform X3 [Ruditapes philippinarum]|uniref:alpha-2Da adrenergic receptor-like isoform X3 n=1 Tax=Ruditapes philippinarum TaxID=129788 RepID=UPI00295BE75F|nr:alpha-2Da adrenergic receptor-like isoform X3 [Ruditapes philippinarum]
MTTSPVGGEIAVDDYPTGSKAIEILILCMIIVINAVGNVSLWFVVLRSQTLRTVTNMFILGLSAADLLVATVNMPLTVVTIIKGYWMLSNTACVAVGFLNMLTLVTSVLSLCNISINRFFMVCRPSKFKDIYTTRNAILMIVATVTCAVLLSSPPLLGWSEYVYTPTHSFCFADWVNYQSYAYFMIGCCFGIPFAVMTFCNICIIRSVRESRRKVKTTYRATISSTVNSTYDCEPPKDNDGQNVNNSKQNTPSVTAQTEVVYNNNNTTISDTINADDEHVDIHLEIPKYDAQNTDQKQSDKRPLHDALSDDSSSESNSALIKQQGRNSQRRNKLFEDGTQSKEKVKSFHRQTNSESNRNQNNVDNNLLHPSWKRKSVSELSKESASAIDSGTETDTEKKFAANKSKNDTSVQLRSPKKIRRREEIRLAFSLIIVVVLFVICWLPYCISMLLSIYIPDLVPREFHMFTLLIGYANSGCNPVVYGLMNQRFKVGFKRLFCFWKSHVFTLSSSNS